MPSARDAPPATPLEAVRWPKVVVRVPPDWKRWLEEAAEARGLTVAALVRQCIRGLMVERHK